MRRNILSLLTLLSAVFIFASCLGSNDQDTTSYGDTAITSFSLGTLARTMHTTSSKGTDSVYTTSVTGSNYLFNIDQFAGQIYNADSLPIGTKPMALCTINTKNAGTVVYSNLKGDSLLYFSTSDSVNFSSPREFRVYASNGSGYRKYKITLNVHQQDSDTIVWKNMANNSNIGNLKAMKAVEYNSNLYVFGSTGTSTVAYASSASDGKTWNPVQFNRSLSSDSYKSIIINGGSAYIISDGEVLKSTNMNEWTSVNTNSSLKQLVGSSTTELYALNNNNTISVSKDNGATWSDDKLGNDAALLPINDINYTTYNLSSNDSTDRVLVVGNRATSAGDITATVWTKLVEYSKGSAAGSWETVEKSEDNVKNYLPDLTSLVMIPYDNGMLAFGGYGQNSKTTKFSQFYQSYDSGITWINNKHYYFPKGFTCSDTSFTALKDNDNYIWIFCGSTGQVWKGRLNRLGWTKGQTSFVD
ncbi:MAG: hypothetical protein KA955_00975 [Prevotella sp.]|nr:hypothetical protein [Prevotella sp.]